MNVVQAFVWIMCHVQFVLFTTKSTKDTKVLDKKTPNFVLFALRPKAYGRRVVSFVVKTSSQ